MANHAVEGKPLMPSIDIHRKHPHSLKRAKTAVTDTAAAMREKFDIESSWSGNTLNFSRAGVDGKIRVTADDIHVTAELGFLLRHAQAGDRARD